MEIGLSNLWLKMMSITSQTEHHVCFKNSFRCTHQEGLFVSSDDLDNISILLDEDKDLEEEITHLFNTVNIFIFKFERKTQPIRL